MNEILDDFSSKIKNISPKLPNSLEYGTIHTSTGSVLLRNRYSEILRICIQYNEYKNSILELHFSKDFSFPVILDESDDGNYRMVEYNTWEQLEKKIKGIMNSKQIKEIIEDVYKATIDGRIA